MKTYTTKRGIEFELSISEMGSQSVEVQAICEEGVNTFTIDFDFPIKEDWSLYRNLEDGKTDDLEDMLDEVTEWVDQVTIAFIASEVARVCVKKSVNGEYWDYSIFHNGALNVSLFQMRRTSEGNYESIGSHFTNGETEIKELLNKLK